MIGRENIRQFINLLKRAAYMGVSLRALIAKEKIDSSPISIPNGQSRPEDDRRFLPQQESEIVPEAEIRRTYMTHALKLCRGNWTKAAWRLQVSINTLRKWAAENGD